MKNLLSVLLVLASIAVKAQTSFPVSGKVELKESKEPAVGATVFAITNESKVAAGTVTDNEGRFTINLPRGEYTLKINYLGTVPYEEELRIWRDNYLGTIQLEDAAEDLEGVEVKEKAPIATVEGDTTSFSSKAYKTNQNASAEDLVKKMPGMQEVNGELRAQGEKVQQVLVDGKQFFGQSPKTALSTLPAEVVDKIQVFDDQSEQSKASGVDDGTRIKTLNVVTKINMRNGEFGRVYAGGGTDERYSAGANLNMFRGERRLSLLGQMNNINQQNFSTDDLLGVVGDNSGGGRRRGSSGPGGGGRPSFLTGFAAGSSASDFMVNPSGGITQTVAGGANYQDVWGEKVDVSGSYFYNQGNNSTITRTFQNYFLSNLAGQEYTELDSQLSTNINHKLNAKLVYRVTPKLSFFYLPSVRIQQNNGESFLNGSTVREGTIINTLRQTFESDLVATNISNNLMMRLNGEKRGRSLFVDLKHSYENTNGDQFLESGSWGVDSSQINQLGILDEVVNGYNASVMYSEPLGKKGMGAFISYDISNTSANSNLNTFSNAPNRIGGLLDTALSSMFTNDWLTQTAGIGFRKFNRSMGFVVRLRFQNAALNNQQVLPLEERVEPSFNNFLPFALFRKRFENKATFFTMYRTYAIQPTANQLSNALDNTNPLQLSTGNAALQQQYGHWIMARYNAANTEKGAVFYAMLSGGFAQNYIGQSTYTALQDEFINGIALNRGVQLSNPVNLQGQYTVNGFTTYGFPLNKLKSNLNFNVSASANRIPSLINNVESFTFNKNAGLGVVLSSNISENLDFTVSTDGAFNQTENSVSTLGTINYWVQTSKLSYDWIMPKGFTFRTNLTHQSFYGLSESLDNNVLLWTAGIGKQVFKNKRGEIQVSMFDILGQNNNVSQQFFDTYFEESNRNVLTRYVMLSFSYNIRHWREDKGNAN
jgi:hypothetical protein